MKIGIDFDDVLAPFVSIACDLCNKEKGTNYSAEDISCWGFGGSQAIHDVSPYYRDKRVFEAQTVSPQAKSFMSKLMKKGDVYIITAIEGSFMTLRYEQIHTAFPELPPSNILMGSAKNLVKLDIILDDGPHNILKSCADYPVLMRRPWNKDLFGVLSVNGYEEFLLLVDQIKNSVIEGKTPSRVPSVVALIGPSGAKKHHLADELAKKGFAEKVTSITSKTMMSSNDIAAKTIYGGREYGYQKSMIEKHLAEGTNVVLAVDMAGAMMLKRLYPTTLVFCRQARELMFLDIVSDQTLSNEEKAIRCTSMENEIKHEVLCDVSVRTEDIENAANAIISFFG